MGSEGVAGEQFAETLAELKARSGRSYEALSRRTGVSKSALHRYCVGDSLPNEFGVIERIALACKASPTELEALHMRWSRADRERRHDKYDNESEIPPKNEGVYQVRPGRCGGPGSAAAVGCRAVERASHHGIGRRAADCDVRRAYFAPGIRATWQSGQRGFDLGKRAGTGQLETFRCHDQ